MEYEDAAQKSIKKVHKEQIKEVKEFKKIMNKDPTFKVVLSQDLIMLRNKIDKLISIGNYGEANNLKEKADQLEKVEYTKAAIESEMEVDKDLQKLILVHEKTIHAMLRRIERDRREQTKHRQEDTNRLLQRNKNLIRDINNRQNQEKRKTKQFLTWALSDIHTFHNLKSSKSIITQSGKEIMNKRLNKLNKMKNPKSLAKLIGSHTHKINRNVKKFNSLMKNQDILPLVKNQRKIRSEFKVYRKDKILRNKSFAGPDRDSKFNNNLINICKHKAGMKPLKNNLHNYSYNDAYGILEDNSEMNYSATIQ